MFGSPSTKFDPIPCEAPITVGWALGLRFNVRVLKTIFACNPRFALRSFRLIYATVRPLWHLDTTGTPHVCTFADLKATHSTAKSGAAGVTLCVSSPYVRHVGDKIGHSELYHCLEVRKTS